MSVSIRNAHSMVVMDNCAAVARFSYCCMRRFKAAEGPICPPSPGFRVSTVVSTGSSQVFGAVKCTTILTRCVLDLRLVTEQSSYCL